MAPEPPPSPGKKEAAKSPKALVGFVTGALEPLRRAAGALRKLLARLGKRLARHPLCNLGLHKWQMRGWGRCARRRCDAYRSFGKLAGVKE